MKKVLFFLAGFFLILTTLSLADDAGKKDQPADKQDEGAVTYRATSSAVELEGHSCAERPKKVFTAAGKGLWVEHEFDSGGCADIDGAKENGGLEAE